MFHSIGMYTIQLYILCEEFVCIVGNNNDGNANDSEGTTAKCEIGNLSKSHHKSNSCGVSR